MTALVVVALIVVIALGRRVVGDLERMRLVAEAEHELRGPLQAIAFVLEGTELQPEMDRARVALADLAEARSGRRSTTEPELVQLDRLVWRAATASDLAARRAGGGVHLDWKAGPVVVRAHRGRLAQALTNLLANAIEHGGGQIRVIGRRTRRGIRIEVCDSGRGHGLAIATKAVREAGGTLSAARAGEGTSVALELPLAGDAGAPPAALEPPLAGSDAGAPPAAHLRAGYRPIASSDPPAA